MDKDHFSSVHQEYKLYRPEYSFAMLQELSFFCKTKQLALDVGCGSGQATLGLSKIFTKVYGIDFSKDQIADAPQRENILYQVGKAEELRSEENSVDLVLAAQSFHWFDKEKFFQSVRRVLKPEGVLCLLGYGKSFVNREVHQIYRKFYVDIVGPYWPKERKMVESGYDSIVLPEYFQTIAFDKKFEIQLYWTVKQFLGYLSSFSATKRYIEQEQKNPIELIKKEAEEVWGEGKRTISWPIFYNLSKKIS